MCSIQYNHILVAHAVCQHCIYLAELPHMDLGYIVSHHQHCFSAVLFVDSDF